MAISVFLCVILFTGLGHLVFGVRNWKGAPSDVLILAAHQDDCVVLAGEYALWALKAGKNVSVVYLTSGADDPSSARANLRSQEAISAWFSAGVPEQNLYFLGCKQSDINGPSANSKLELMNAAARIEEIVRNAELGTCIFIPAEGETHVDHRVIRHISLQAIKNCARSDLSVFEAPEYNNYFSFIQSPRKALRYFVSILPLNSYLSKFFSSNPFPGYARFGRAYWLPHVDSIHQKKNDMLRMFASENGDLLVSHFGWRNQFRPVKWTPTSSDEHFGIRYIHVGEQRLGLSVVGLCLSVYLLFFGVAWQLSQWLIDNVDGSTGLFLVVICIFTLVIIVLRGRKKVETQLFYAIGGLGMVAELFTRIFTRIF